MTLERPSTLHFVETMSLRKEVSTRMTGNLSFTTPGVEWSKKNKRHRHRWGFVCTYNLYLTDWGVHRSRSEVQKKGRWGGLWGNAHGSNRREGSPIFCPCAVCFTVSPVGFSHWFSVLIPISVDRRESSSWYSPRWTWTTRPLSDRKARDRESDLEWLFFCFN